MPTTCEDHHIGALTSARVLIHELHNRSSPPLQFNVGQAIRSLWQEWFPRGSLLLLSVCGSGELVCCGLCPQGDGQPNATNSMLRLNARTKRDVHVPRSICRCPYVFGRPLLFLFLLASPWLYDVDTCMRTSIDKCTAVDEHVAVRKSGRRLCCVRLRYPCCSATSTPPCVLSVPPSRPVFSARSTLRLPSRFVPYGMW